MKTAIILHGMPDRDSYFDPTRQSQSNSHWLPWLQQQLIVNGILAQTPELPEPYAPDYEKWRSVFELFPVNEETILVGHSCSAGFLLRWLSENKKKVGKLALVAPWTDPSGKFAPKMFGNFAIDPTLPERTTSITMFCSNDDGDEELQTFKMLKEKLPGIKVVEFSDRGHFTSEDRSKIMEFPELLNELLS